MASKNGHHVPGTPYRYRHGWVPVAPGEGVLGEHPDSIEARQLAARHELLAHAQRQISHALNTPPEEMSDHDFEIASRVLDNMTNSSMARMLDDSRKVLPQQMHRQVEDKLGELKGDLAKEKDKTARRKLILHIASIVAGVVLALLSAHLPVPEGSSEFLAIFPELATAFAEHQIESVSAAARRSRAIESIRGKVRGHLHHA